MWISNIYRGLLYIEHVYIHVCIRASSFRKIAIYINNSGIFSVMVRNVYMYIEREREESKHLPLHIYVYIVNEGGSGGI